MSNAEKGHRGLLTSQLKKELNQATKVLESLTNQVNKIEAGLIDSSEALAIESSQKEQLFAMQRHNNEIKERLQKCQRERDRDAESFTTATLKMSKEFQTRLQNNANDNQSKVEEVQLREKHMEQKWRRALESEKTQVERLRQKEDSDRHQFDIKLKNAEESWQIKEDALQAKLKELESNTVKFSDRNAMLMGELDENLVILKGRDTEVLKLTKRLDDLEAFSSKSSDQITSTIAGLQRRLEEVCSKCVDSAEMLPGWNQFPDQIQRKGLPRYYSIDSIAGRELFTAALQHSVCAAMVDNICNSLGLNVCQEVGRVADALYRSNRSHEAVWRLMTANAILGNREMLEASKKRFGEVADDILSYWKIFRTESLKNEFQNMLTKFLFVVFENWLDLMRIRDKISVSIDGASHFFDYDPGEQTVNVPGDFIQPNLHPTLCLFPAFLEDAFKDRTKQQKLFRKGKMMYQSSAVLLQALREEQEVSSPRLSNKKVAKT